MAYWPVINNFRSAARTMFIFGGVEWGDINHNRRRARVNLIMSGVDLITEIWTAGCRKLTFDGLVGDHYPGEAHSSSARKYL